MSRPRPLVVSDIDLTLWCGCMLEYELGGPRGCHANQSVLDMLEVLAAAGAEVRFWSGGGRHHAERVVKLLRLDYVSGCHDKPEGRLTPERAIATLGRLPDLSFDDDPREAIEGVPFKLVEGFSPHGIILRRIIEEDQT